MLKRRNFSRVLLLAAVFLAFGYMITGRTSADSGINQEMAFEGKIVLTNGTNLPDNTYNMEFKIYNGGTDTGGGTLEWTENYLVGGSGGIPTTSGTFEVNLGSVTPFGSNVDWDSDTLWLSLQVGNTSACTITTTFQANCGGDGEMTPYIHLTSVPYAFNALELGGVAATSYGVLANTQTWSGLDTFSSLLSAAAGLSLTGGATQSYSSATSGTSADTQTVTNSATSGTVSVSADTLTLAGASTSGTNTVNGLSFTNITAPGGSGTTTFNGLSFGTGYTNLITSANFNVAASGNITNSGTYDGNTFTSTALAFSGNTANTISGTNGQTLTIDSQGSGELLLGSASGTLGLTSTTTTFQHVASGTTTIDLDDTGLTTLQLENSGSGLADLNLYGGDLETGSTPTVRLTNAGALENINTIDSSGLATIGGGIADTGTLTNSGDMIIQTTGGLALLTASSENSNVEIGSPTLGTTEVDLQLDSYNTFADANTCSTTIDQGAMYYNTVTNAIRVCINGGWEDLVSTAGLGIVTFGVIADTGATPGDISNHSSTTAAAGPCKVSRESATSVNITGCAAYSGGRKVVYPGGTITGLTDTNGHWTHICFANATTPFAAASTLNALANTTTETANMPEWNANNPIVCVADIKGTGTNIDIYDTRVFTNTEKTFVNTYVAMGLGWVAKDDGAAGASTVTTPGTTASGYLKGVIVASAGTACTTACGPNAIMAYSGPVYVKASSGTLTASDYVGNSTATNGYAMLAAGSTALNPYQALGMAETGYIATCSSAVNCNLSMLVDLDIR